MNHQTRYVAAGSTVALGIGAGLALSYPLILRKSVAALDAKQRLAVWQASYNAGKAAILPIPLMGAFGFVTSAIMAAAYDHGRGVIPLSAAAALSCCHIVFTVGFMLPTNNRLMDLNNRIKALRDAEVKEVETKLWKWYNLHAVRILSLFAATSVGAFGVAALQ